MFATEATLADFTFADGRVVYATPSLDDASLELTSENAVQIRMPDVAAGGELSAPATPGPATALLILSGLFGLRYRRPLP